MGLAYRGGKGEGWSYDEWLWLGRWVGLGVWEGEWVGGGAVCVWCWDRIGKAVDVLTKRYSTYPHPIPIQHQVFPTYRIRTARQTPLSPPSTNSHPPYLPYIHSTQLYSGVSSTSTNLIRPSTISETLRTLSHKQTHPTPSQPDTLPHLNPIQIPHHTHPIYYRTLQTLTPPPLYALPAAKTLISPSKAHMSLGRFCCALTIEYKCKTSHINKRLYNSNEQILNTNVNYRM